VLICTDVNRARSLFYPLAPVFKKMRKDRMSRFKVGDQIKILSVVATPFVGL
jgi:hypothetical protein